MSTKTLAMLPVGANVHAGLFSSKKCHEARIPLIFLMIVYYSSPTLLVIWIYVFKNFKISHSYPLKSCL